MARSRFHVLTPPTEAIMAIRRSSVSFRARSSDGVVGMRSRVIRSKMDLLQTREPDTASERLVSAKALVMASVQVLSSTSLCDDATKAKKKSKRARLY